MVLLMQVVGPVHAEPLHCPRSVWAAPLEDVVVEWVVVVVGFPVLLTLEVVEVFREVLEPPDG